MKATIDKNMHSIILKNMHSIILKYFHFNMEQNIIRKSCHVCYQIAHGVET